MDTTKQSGTKATKQQKRGQTAQESLRPTTSDLQNVSVSKEVFFEAKIYKDTPFNIVRKRDDKGFYFENFAAIGNMQVSPKFEKIEDLEAYIEAKPWPLIIVTTAIMAGDIREKMILNKQINSIFTLKTESK